MFAADQLSVIFYGHVVGDKKKLKLVSRHPPQREEEEEEDHVGSDVDDDSLGSSFIDVCRLCLDTISYSSRPEGGTK